MEPLWAERALREADADPGRPRATARSLHRAPPAIGVPGVTTPDLGSGPLIAPVAGTKIRRATHHAAAPVDAPAGARRSPGGGLPDQLRAGVERLSGFSLDDVRVHPDSDRPSRIGALAYTEGTDIYLGPGQERHLPHEAWHVVQQAQGRVRPTARLERSAVNDDSTLEREADRMGARAAALSGETPRPATLATARPTVAVIQGQFDLPGWKTVKTLDLFKSGQKKNYDTLVAQVKTMLGIDEEFDAKRFDFHLKNVINAPDGSFYSVEQLVGVLVHDYIHKAPEGGTPTLQERYLTEYGWKGQHKAMTETASSTTAAKSKQPVKSKQPAKSKQEGSSSSDGGKARQLKLYRTMSIAEWFKIKEDKKDLDGLGKHLGDYKQAQQYLHRQSEAKAAKGRAAKATPTQGEDDAEADYAAEGDRVLVEFTLQAGAESTLFSTGTAFAAANKKKKVNAPPHTATEYMKAVLSKGGEQSFPKASGNEGLADEAIGVKSEKHGEAGFSIAISASARCLLGKLVESMKVIGANIGGATTERPTGIEESTLPKLKG